MQCTTLLRKPKPLCNFDAFFDKLGKWFSYRVGSANFSRRKIGHAHDNSADSENVAGAREPSVDAHFIFHLENGQGNQSFFLSTTKKKLKRVNRKLSQRTVDTPSTGRFCEASGGPEKSLVLKKEKANFVDSRKLLLRGYKFKGTKHDRFGKDMQRLRLRRLTIDRRRRSWTPSSGRSSWFFFLFSTSSSNNFRFAFFALKEASQAFTLKISIGSAKINHVLRCSLSRELTMGEARLRNAVRGAASAIRSCSWLNLRSNALPSAGFVRRLESLSWKVRLGSQCYSICFPQFLPVFPRNLTS